MTYKPSQNRIQRSREEMGSLSSSDRAIVSKLARVSRGGLLAINAAAEALGINHRAAALKLATLARRGWLLRARRGLYLILPLEAEPGRPMVVEDPWVLAREAFSPCYIGGWSAAEHWGLTEQIFRSTLVVTAANIRDRSPHLLGQEFHLFWVPRVRISGTTMVWRGPEQVPVSGRERTIVDCLRHPELCGGIRHLTQIMREYGQDREHDFAKLTHVAGEFGSGAAWKRLGYITELLWPNESTLLEEAKRWMTTGYVKLDPSVQKTGTLTRRWRLWVNVPLNSETAQA